jgi:hypothetical protein
LNFSTANPVKTIIAVRSAVENQSRVGYAAFQPFSASMDCPVLAGCALACIGLVLLAAGRRPLVFVHAIGFWPWLLLTFLIMASGGMILFMAQAALGEGIRQERWSQQGFRGPRRMIEHRIVRVVEVLALVAAVVLLTAELITGRPAVGTLCWSLIYLPMLIRGIRTTLKAPRVSPSAMRFEKLAPLHPQHWGGGAKH